MSTATLEQIEPTAGKSLLAAGDATGDSRIEWSKDNPTEVEAAREMFARLKAKAYRAYKIVKGDQREIIHSFDPAAEKIIMMPQTVGG